MNKLNDFDKLPDIGELIIADGTYWLADELIDFDFRVSAYALEWLGQEKYWFLGIEQHLFGFSDE